MIPPGPDLVASSLAVIAVVLFGAAAHTYRHHPGNQGLALTALLASAGLDALASPLGHFVEEGTLAIVLGKAPEVVFVVAWFVFALEYSGYERFLNWRTVGLVVAGSVVYAVLGMVQSLGTASSTLVVIGRVGHMLVLGAMFASATFVLIGLVRYEYLDTASALLLTVGALAVPFVPLATQTPGNVTSGADPQPIAELVAYSLLTVGLVVSEARDTLFDVTPAAGTIGRIATFDDVGDAVIVINEGNRIADMNDAAEWALSTSVEDVGGRPLSVIFEDQAAELSQPGKTEFVHETPVGRRHFEATVSPVTGDDGQRIGKTMVVRDVTDRVTREQQIEVLNRVLRHNLRNRATNVMLTAELVAEGEEPPERAGDIVDAMEDLLAVGEKARDLEEALGEDGGHGRATLQAVVGDVAERLRSEYQEAKVSLDETPTADVAANPRVVELILWHLGTNAVEHNDADEPTVELSGSVTDDAVLFRVADNGPGIPDHDREIIDSGAETPLQHSTGIGLWCISWLVTHNGGELSIEDNEPRGTVATVRLPLEEECDCPKGGESATTQSSDSASEESEPRSTVERLVHFLRSHSQRGT